MELCASCMCCLMNRQEERVRDLGTQNERNDFLRRVARIIGESAQEDSAPVLVERINGEYTRLFGPVTDYDGIKKEFNDLMLSLEPQIRKKLAEKGDRLHAAMLYARAANYIDFGMAGRVERETLFALLERAADETLEEETWQAFLESLAEAKSLVYVTDNCGEVVCDRIAAQELTERFPDLSITFLVRGRAALNDATREDALQAGVEGVAAIADNGCGVAGTPLAFISEDARGLLERADVILAKGQGNFETMHGCGLPIYYSFLCKCDWFTRRFGMEKNRGVFIREDRVASRLRDEKMARAGAD